MPLQWECSSGISGNHIIPSIVINIMDDKGFCYIMCLMDTDNKLVTKTPVPRSDTLPGFLTSGKNCMGHVRSVFDINIISSFWP